MLLMFSVALPVFESVASSADEVVPTEVLGKVSVGVSVAIGAGAGVPVPVSVADCVVGVALSVTVRVAEKLVAEAGVNMT
jgi:serine acetyltransferase